MSLCTWFTEFFFGKKETASVVGTEEVKPLPEMFCRSNRRDEWTKRILSDMINIGADLLLLSTPSKGNGYRGVRQNEKLTIWDVETLAEVPLATLWCNGTARGSYSSSREVDDYRRRDPNHKLMKDYDILPGFINNVNYSAGMYPSHHSGGKHYMAALGINIDHLRMVADFNTDKRYRIMTLPDGTELYRNIPDILQQGMSAFGNALFSYTTQTGEIRTYPSWVMCSLKRVTLVDVDGNDAVLDDPIKITLLSPGEGVGTEAYIFLVEGLANTYSRMRYRIEVESERIFANKIVDVDALLGSIHRRMEFQGIRTDGKLFIDNIRYLCLDGTTHTSDAGGFLTIGAEAFRTGRKKAGPCQHTHVGLYNEGALIVSHVDFPKEPIY